MESHLQAARRNYNGDVTLYNTTTNSSSYKVRNVHVHRGMSFATHKFAGVPINAAYEHTVTLALPSTSNSTIVS